MVTKGRHIKVPPAGCKGDLSRHVKVLSRHILAGRFFCCATTYFCERPAAIFHDPLDPPKMSSDRQEDFSPDFMANRPLKGSLACNFLGSEAIPLWKLWQIRLKRAPWHVIHREVSHETSVSWLASYQSSFFRGVGGKRFFDSHQF